MMRSTHSISVRLCIPTLVSSRMSAGRPITWANRRATLKYWPYSASRRFSYCCSTNGSSSRNASWSTSAAMRPGLVGVVDALAVERVDGAGGVADHEVRRPGLGADRASHRQPAAGRATLGLVGLELPVVGRGGDVLAEQVGGVDALEVAERGQQPDADVHRPVAHREDPPVARHGVAVAVLHVEAALDPRLGGERAAPVAPDGRARRATPGGATCPAPARSGSWRRRPRPRTGPGPPPRRGRPCAGRPRRARSPARSSAASASVPSHRVTPALTALSTTSWSSSRRRTT